MDTIIGRTPPGGAPGAGTPRARPGLIDAGEPAAPTQSPAPATVAADDMIVDATEKTFMQDVVQASRDVPVIVDFWATWCGPCKQLTPTLERVTRAAGGRVKLVKVDIDKNRGLVKQLMQLGLPLQSVPTVAAFWQGQVADIFQGAQPEGEVKRWVDALLKAAGSSSPGMDLAAEAKAALDEGQGQEAGELYSALLQEDPENAEAWGGLVRALMLLGQEEQAAQALEQVPAKLREHAAVSGARSALALATEGRAAAAQLAQFERRLAADPGDLEARYDLATALNAMGRRAEAADALLEVFRRDRAWNDDAARKQLLKLFEAWGFDDPATVAARRKLSALLFS